MAGHLIECKTCGKQYTGSGTKKSLGLGKITTKLRCERL